MCFIALERFRALEKLKENKYDAYSAEIVRLVLYSHFLFKSITLHPNYVNLKEELERNTSNGTALIHQC